MGKGNLRNKKPCICGNPRKYKDCCWGLSDMQIEKKLKARIVKQVFSEAGIRTCLYPDRSECSERIIRAHSLQNNGVLTKLSVDGYLYMINPLFDDEGNQLKLQRVGRAVATTFTGFCQKHDKEVFAPIEDIDYLPGDKNQEALFAFRALTKEWYAKLLAEKVVVEELKYINNPSLNAFREGLRLALKDIQQEVNLFVEALLHREVEKIHTKTLIFEEESDIAVSSAITMAHDFNGNRLKHFTEHAWIKPDQLFLTVFPQNGNTYCLLSYDSAAQETFTFLDEQLFNQDIQTQKELLSRLILHHCENVVYSPRLIESFTSQQIEILEERVKDSVTLSVEESLIDKELGLSFFK